MTSDRQNRAQAALLARWGVPTKIRPDVVDDDGTEVVRVYALPCREAAEGFAQADRELWGNRSRVELREGVGWCVVVDLRARVEAARLEHPLPRRWS